MDESWIDRQVARNLDRRQFFGAGISAAFALSGLPRLVRAGCDLTTSDVLGPYYVAGAPQRTVIASPDEPGPRLFLQGRVRGDDCATNLEGTIIDVWQASQDGCYSVLENCPDEDPFNLRGQFQTDAQGNYAFESVMPGSYPGRCLHIHYRIAPVGGPVLVTQLYFAGDPGIPSDPFASRPQAVNRIIPLTEDANGFHGVFDLALNVETSETDDPEDFTPTSTVLHPAYPNPSSGPMTLRWSLPREGAVAFAIFDGGGRRVRMLATESMSAGYHTVEWDGRDELGRATSPGIYFARVTAAGVTRSQKLIRIAGR